VQLGNGVITIMHLSWCFTPAVTDMVLCGCLHWMWILSNWSYPHL